MEIFNDKLLILSNASYSNKGCYNDKLKSHDEILQSGERT